MEQGVLIKDGDGGFFKTVSIHNTFLADNNKSKHCYAPQQLSNYGEKYGSSTINTLKVYTAKQEEWKNWFIEKKIQDGYTVSDEKLSFFLMEYVSNRGNKCRKNDDDTSVPLGLESVKGFEAMTAAMMSSRAANAPDIRKLQDKMSEFLAMGSNLFSSNSTTATTAATSSALLSTITTAAHIQLEKIHISTSILYRIF
ncbi:hypothetical protein PHYBLDRAFT_174698 [Phycomyces blakesleeanus NRRL 1555(-)]|uniref:Uncharacterized protein n=1 Tax=Phycomyces blakesleeanus (strain ATCC 8743b / DSM 1359 / FGSC 10004 / NBRC 33097 / NRRL 1555) TaxID=763407 RepID=A0A162T983_PHYB8|nr:hypothetical protein PHYBLDRAFT_174698 [Phycomyces blakesleeanus NRRL 1555(-)]OAD66992.1 hypothetical protein PHYBLDRAFT_174698 [Phycomyces blakesleeanus NRRL 1555(-)]|eukprot:XP_018285032.1 hypothetical protein PHYBLDRAFT_174698 [Phycomyces blakesleeanus NRRL 1555(-)]